MSGEEYCMSVAQVGEGEREAPGKAGSVGGAAARGVLHLGVVVSTPGALEAMEEAGVNPRKYLRRHMQGDWGELCEEDREENEFSLEHGLRVMSAYRLPTDVKIWVITEADRSATTFLLPAEY
jgi:hypothetical protein